MMSQLRFILFLTVVINKSLFCSTIPEEDLVLLNKYKKNMRIQPVVSQTGGTCYIEATLEYMDRKYSQSLGKDVSVSRVDFYRNLIIERFKKNFIKPIFSDYQRHLRLKKREFLSSGSTKWIVDNLLMNKKVVLEPKRGLYETYRDSKYFELLFHKIEEFSVAELFRINKKRNLILNELLSNDLFKKYINNLTILNEKIDFGGAKDRIFSSEDVVTFSEMISSFEKLSKGQNSNYKVLYPYSQQFLHKISLSFFGVNDLIASLNQNYNDVLLLISKYNISINELKLEQIDRFNDFLDDSFKLIDNEMLKRGYKAPDPTRKFTHILTNKIIVTKATPYYLASRIKNEGEVMFSYVIRDHSRRRSASEMGVISAPNGPQKRTKINKVPVRESGHVVVATGVIWGGDGYPLFFVFKNSWGVEQGYLGHNFMHISYFKNIKVSMALDDFHASGCNKKLSEILKLTYSK